MFVGGNMRSYDIRHYYTECSEMKDEEEMEKVVVEKEAVKFLVLNLVAGPW